MAAGGAGLRQDTLQARATGGGVGRRPGVDVGGFGRDGEGGHAGVCRRGGV